MASKKKQLEESSAHRAGRVAIVGRPNVGKSTFLNAVLGEKIAIVSKHPQTTRDSVLGIVTEPGSQIAFVDTPGLHQAKTRLGARMNQVARDAAREADAVIFMTAISSPVRAEVTDEDREILQAIPSGIPTIAVINKVDRVREKAELFPVLEAFLKARNFVAVVPISARSSDGVERVMKEARALVPEGPRLYEDDSISDRPARFFVAEFVREQILGKTRQEVPHGVAVVVDRFDESGKIPHIDLSIHVDRDSHKRILIGAKGSLLRAIGTDARKHVEELLGQHVHLQLWVRVTPGWYESEAQLRELGYSKQGKDG